MMWATPRYLAETKRHSGQFDLTGTVTTSLGMTALVYGVVRSATAGWGNSLTMAAILAGVVLLGVFVRTERRAPQPILPLCLFTRRERVGAYVARLLFLGAMMGFWFFITQFLQGVKHYSRWEAGFAFLPMTVANFGMALAVPRFTRRLGNGWLLAGSIAVTLLGLVWLSRVAVGTPYATGLATRMVLIGMGQGGSLSLHS